MGGVADKIAPGDRVVVGNGDDLETRFQREGHNVRWGGVLPSGSDVLGGRSMDMEVGLAELGSGAGFQQGLDRVEVVCASRVEDTHQ